MGASYLIGMLLFAWSCVRSAWPALRLRALGGKTRLGLIALCCLLLCCLLRIQLTATDQVARSLLHLSTYASGFPIPMIGAGFLYSADVDAPRAMIIEVAATAEALILLLLGAMLVFNAGHEKLITGILTATAAALAALALFAPAMESADLYSYVGLALTPQPYHPAAYVLPGDAAVINRLWGLPILPSPYGPLWLALSRVVVAMAPTLGTKLFAFRVVELVSIAVALVMLRMLGASRPAIVLFALNPAVYDLFVTEGHNDMLGVTLILAAMWARKRSLILAVALATAAGLIKLPLAFIAMTVFVAEPTLLRRLVLGFAPALLATLVSFLAGGSAFLWALHRVYAVYATASTPFDSSLHVALAGLAILALLVALTTGRFIRGAVYAMPALGHFPLAQYLAWSFPFALREHEPDTLFLAALPVAVYLLNTDYAMNPFFIVVRSLLVIGSVGALLVAWRRRRP
ncbi:MAG TPA: hypothetical protein VGD50_05475 [Candidatus Baltobacteraceae bacterium]